MKRCETCNGTGTSPPPATAWEGFTNMVRKDFAWLVVTLILLLCLFYVATIAADHENACDQRYYDFVWACYEATGKIPSEAAYDMTLWNFSIDERQDGDYFT